MGKLRWWCFSPIAIEMLYNWDFGRSQAFQGKGNLFQTSNYWITKERSSQVLKVCFHAFASWSKSAYLNASQDFQINWLTLLISLSGCPNLDIWKGLLAFFFFLFFLSHASMSLIWRLNHRPSLMQLPGKHLKSHFWYLSMTLIWWNGWTKYWRKIIFHEIAHIGKRRLCDIKFLYFGSQFLPWHKSSLLRPWEVCFHAFTMD